MRRMVFAAILLAGCAGSDVSNPPLPQGASIPPSQPIRWRLDQRCVRDAMLTDVTTRESLAAGCRDPQTRDFVSVAMSGGGTKAAVFAGETLFYLKALGILSDVSMMSSVSGGSFTAALYALSCEPDDAACLAQRLHGLARPVWSHDPVLKTLGQGYGDVVDDQIVRLLTPGVQTSVSAGRFADIIDKDYFNAGDAKGKFTFADLSPKRPHLFLNATITSENRGGLEDVVAPPCSALAGRGYLRRRTPDEFFHFAYTQYYFGLLGSRIDGYPLSAGVAASAAFPALIDNAVLTDHCATRPDEATVRLMDGGANDNQALIEIYAALAELVYGQRRSDLWTSSPGALELLNGARDQAWVFVVNSSVTETTGQSSARAAEAPRGAMSFFSGLLDKVTSATDTYSAEGYILRRQDYLTQAELLKGLRDYARFAPVHPVEISLTELDQYYWGGTEAALRHKVGLGAEETDVAQTWAMERIRRQQAAYPLLDDAPRRHGLGLSDWHPQCYFDMRKRLDASLISLSDDDQACLRDAARWSAALRAEEICASLPAGGASPAGMKCEDGHVRLAEPAAIVTDPKALAGSCDAGGRITRMIAAAPRSQDPDPRVTCRAL